MGVLRDYIDAIGTGPGISRWEHYLDIFERHFDRFRGREVRVVEIGVFHGGSLHMWRHYFGPRSRITGIDVNPECAALAAEGIDILIGDQGDRGFLRWLREELPRIDILIDDGGHTMAQQIATFEELYPHLAPDGVYVCEDVHTSYWPKYGGGLRREGTFVEYAKGLVDRLHAWHLEASDALPVDAFTRSTDALHFYDSVLVIEKRPREAPRKIRSGSKSW